MGAGRRFSWTATTSALNVLAKEQLLRWYARTAAWDTLQNAEKLRKTSEADILYALKSYDLGPEVKRDAGADRGRAVHSALQSYCTSGAIPTLVGCSDATRGFVQALCAALVDLDPEPVMVERIVGSPKHGFAGRFDLIANIGEDRVLIDLKTSRGAERYPESHLQLAGYQLAFGECGIEPVDKALVLALNDDGSYQTAECLAEGEDFLKILLCHKALGRVRSDLRAREKLG